MKKAKKEYWFIFNSNGTIISKEYETEEEAKKALSDGLYDDGESPEYIDGIELDISE